MPETGEIISLGLFRSERDAGMAVDMANLAVDAETKDLNFPRDFYSREDIREAECKLEDYWRPRPSNQYCGVYSIRASQSWKAEVTLYNVQQFLDDFDTEEAAAQAYDRAIRISGVERAVRLQMLNFREPEDYFSEATWQEEKVPEGWSSCFCGVSYHQGSGRYLAKLGRKHVGLFDTELEAARAFDEASLAAGGTSNFPPP